MATNPKENLQYACEKASIALDCLATGNGTLRARMVDAWVPHLSILEAGDFPAELKEQFEYMHERVTSHDFEEVGEGRIHASIRHMTDEEVLRLARDMVQVAIALEIELTKA